MKNSFFISTLFIVASFFSIYSCSSGKETKSDQPWVGTWQMTGYDNTNVAEKDTQVVMILNEDQSIEYITQTIRGEVLVKSMGTYKLNDQQSVLSVYENDELMVEYFIRKVDKDSLIFQSDTFSIQWKRID